MMHAEEEGYEEAAYHPGQGGQQEAHTKEAQLVQPFGEDSGMGEREEAFRHIPAECLKWVNIGVRGSRQSTVTCFYDVGFFDEFVEGVKKVAKGAAHAVVSAAHAVIRWARQTYSTLKSVSCNIAGGGAGILAGAGAGLFTDNPFVAGLAGAVVDRGVTYGC